MEYNLKRGFQSLVSGRVLKSLIGLATLPLVIRLLGPESYGDYAFLMSAFGFMMLFVSPPITEGVQKFIAEDRAADRWQEHVAGFYFKLAVVLAVLGSLGMILGSASGLVGRVLPPKFELFFYFLAAMVVVIQLQNFMRHTLLGLGLEPISETVSVFGLLVMRLGGIGLAAVGFGVVGFLVSEIVATALMFLAGFWFLRKRIDGAALVRAKPQVPTRELLSFNGLNIVTVVLMVSLFHVDVMMLRLLKDGSTTGFYKAALVLAEYIWIVPRALETVMLHSASRLWSQDRQERISALSSSLTRYVFLATSLLAIGIVVLADSFVPLYFGADFDASIAPLVYLMPGAVGFALARPIYGINKSSGRLVPVAAALSVAAVFNAGANYLLIPVYGLTGAAVATSVSYGSMFGLQVACARYLGYTPLTKVRPLRLLAAVTLAGALIYLFDSLIASDILSLALVPPVGFLLFTGSAVVTGAIDVDELREVITSFLPARLEHRIRSFVS